MWCNTPESSSTAAQDLRRSNFTSADARNANFAGAKLQGCYFIKAVTANANFQVYQLCVCMLMLLLGPESIASCHKMQLLPCVIAHLHAGSRLE